MCSGGVVGLGGPPPHQVRYGQAHHSPREMSGTDLGHPQAGRQVCEGNWKLLLLQIHGRADYELTGV